MPHQKPVFSALKSFFETELHQLYSDGEIETLYYIFCEEYLNILKTESRTLEDFILKNDQFIQIQNAVSLLKKGVPYQQILQKTEFYGLNFFINNNVLIPRPETEELVELAISEMAAHQFTDTISILDIGTGSGIIPIILKKYFPKAQITGLDISSEALTVAKKNAETLKSEIDWLQQDYLNSSLKSDYDVIISNPPYIGKSEVNDIENTVKMHEPSIALFSPTEDALIFYRKIAADCHSNLKKDGLLFLEINQLLGVETLELFKNFSSSTLIKDLSGNDRFIFAAK